MIPKLNIRYGRVPEVDLDQIIVPMEKWNALIDDMIDNANIGYDHLDIWQRKVYKVSFRK